MAIEGVHALQRGVNVDPPSLIEDLLRQVEELHRGLRECRELVQAIGAKRDADAVQVERTGYAAAEAPDQERPH